MVAKDPGLRLDRPARELDRFAHPPPVEDEVLKGIAARVEPGER